MANKPVRQFKTHAAPAGARGYQTRRPIRKLEGSKNAVNPVQVGNAFVGKPSDDQGLKEHGEGAGGQLKIDPTIGGGGNNYTLGQLLYQQQLAAANQPPPLPQPSANIPLAVDPRDFGYIPQQPQPRLLPPTANTATIQPPSQRPITPPVYGQPTVGVDITPEQITLPPQQRIIQERPPVVDYGPITTPIERPTPIDMGYVEPEPIQVEYLQPQLEEPRPTAHYGELPVPQDEITNLIDNVIPIETLAPQDIDIPPTEATQPQQENPNVIDYGPIYGEPVTQEAYPGIDKPLPIYDRGVPPAIQQPPITQPPELGMPEIPAETQNLSISYPQEDPVLAGGLPEFPLGKEDYRYEEDYAPGRGNIDEYVGGPIETDREGAREIAEILEEGPTSPASEPTVTADITGEVDTSYPGVDAGETLPAGTTLFPDVDTVEDEGGRGTMTVQETADIEQQQPEIPSHREPTLGGQAAPDPTVTQSPVGGRKWLHTGDQDFAETRWQLFGAGQGDPIITDTPAVSGPVVNRETGEITTEPLTWWQNRPAGSSVSPYTEGISTGTGTGTGAQGPPDITGVSPTSTTGGEGRTPFQTFLENQDNAGELIPGGLNLDAASLKGTAAINQLRSSYNAKDFEGVDSFEKLGNIFENKLGLENFGNGAANFIQELTGMQEGDLKGPGLWNTLNTPIPAFSTGEFGITPLDIITVAVGGLAAIGPVLMHKFMESVLQPFTAAVDKGFKGVFDGIFNRGGQPTGDVAQSDINAADLAVLAEELGISKPAGTIAAGTYYGADGNVIARNMKPLDFGLNTVDGANSFKDVLNNTATKVDPNYETVYYDTKTGQIDVVHADGSVTESASHITVDSDGKMQQGTGKSKKTKKVNWGVNVIGVESIDTVAPRKDKGKGKGKGGKSILDWINDLLGSGEDEEEDETKTSSGN